MSAPSGKAPLLMAASFITFGMVNFAIAWQLYGERGVKTRAQMGKIINGPPLIGGASRDDQPTHETQGK